MERIEKISFDGEAEKLQNEVSGCSPAVSVSSGSLFALQIYMKRFSSLLIFALAIGLSVGSVLAIAPSGDTPSPAAAKKKKKKKSVVKKAAVAVVAPAPTPKVLPLKAGIAASTRTKRKGWVQTWDEPTYKDSAAGDKIEGEDPAIRKAAVEALGPYNGSMVVVDPEYGPRPVHGQSTTGTGRRIPALFDDQSFRGPGCLARRLGRPDESGALLQQSSLDLTDALRFLEQLLLRQSGVKLGYERMNYYAHLFGYGEKAGLNIDGEHPGYFPPAHRKMAAWDMLTSFGEEISQTPLELAALMSRGCQWRNALLDAVSQLEEEIKNFQPQVKRHLDIKNLIDDIKPGMKGAVDFGTAGAPNRTRRFSARPAPAAKGARTLAGSARSMNGSSQTGCGGDAYGRRPVNWRYGVWSGGGRLSSAVVGKFL